VKAVTKARDGDEKLEYHEVLLVTGKKKLEVSVTADGKIKKVQGE
jgi:hypothetical protein